MLLFGCVVCYVSCAVRCYVVCVCWFDKSMRWCLLFANLCVLYIAEFRGVSCLMADGWCVLFLCFSMRCLVSVLAEVCLHVLFTVSVLMCIVV